jgi:hypothetical protein
VSVGGFCGVELPDANRHAGLQRLSFSNFRRDGARRSKYPQLNNKETMERSWEKSVERKSEKINFRRKV